MGLVEEHIVYIRYAYVHQICLVRESKGLKLLKAKAMELIWEHGIRM